MKHVAVQVLVLTCASVISSLGQNPADSSRTLRSSLGLKTKERKAWCSKYEGDILQRIQARNLILCPVLNKISPWFSKVFKSSSDHNELILRSRPDPDGSLLQVLLSQQGLLEAREQVAVLGGVSQSICCFLVDLGQTLLPQLHDPEGTIWIRYVPNKFWLELWCAWIRLTPSHKHTQHAGAQRERNNFTLKHGWAGRFLPEMQPLATDLFWWEAPDICPICGNTHA